MSQSAATLDKLRLLLSSGRFPPDGRLPPERELAAELGVPRSALRKALAFLEAEGKVWRHVGKGTFAGSRPIRGASDLDSIGELTNPAEVMEARLVIEPEIARLAAFRATRAEIERMRHCERRCAGVRDAEGYERWDSAFHAAVAEASHNLLLLSLFNTVNAMRTEASWGRLREQALTRERQETYCRQHAAVLAAIGERRPARAASLMSNHIETVERNLAMLMRRTRQVGE